LHFSRELFAKRWKAAGKFAAVQPYDKQRFFDLARERMEKSKASKQD
jgi:hypothetical protein